MNNDVNIKLSSLQKQEINEALSNGNTKRLFRLLGNYLTDNNFSVQEAAVTLIKTKVDDQKI